MLPFVNWYKGRILFCYEGFAHTLMTVFEYIILLFKRPGVPGRNEKKKRLSKKKNK